MFCGTGKLVRNCAVCRRFAAFIKNNVAAIIQKNNGSSINWVVVSVKSNLGGKRHPVGRESCFFLLMLLTSDAQQQASDFDELGND